MPPLSSGSKNKLRKKPNEAGSKQSLQACYLLHAGFFLALLFGPENRGYIFLRNVVDFQRSTWRHIAEDRTIQFNQLLINASAYSPLPVTLAGKDISGSR
jgi:hypothetical protein